MVLCSTCQTKHLIALAPGAKLGWMLQQHETMGKAGAESPRWIHRLTLVTLLLTLALILWGGVVHSTGSSLACPDWPLCYGEVFPQMKGGIAIEHGHRLLASLVGLFTVILAIGLHRHAARQPPVQHNRRLASMSKLAVLLVIFQGVLGGITVIYKLPLAISSAHLATSMLFSMLLVAMAYATRAPRALVLLPARIKATTGWIGLASAAVLVQIVLGALVRHTGSGLACGLDILRCEGVWWPDWGPAQLHMVHRFGAALVFLLVTATAGRVLWFARGNPELRPLRFVARAQFMLVIIQGLLGMLNILTYLRVASVTAHLAIGALLLCNTLFFYLVLRSSPPQPIGSSSLMAPSAVKATA